MRELGAHPETTTIRPQHDVAAAYVVYAGDVQRPLPGDYVPQAERTASPVAHDVVPPANRVPPPDTTYPKPPTPADEWRAASTPVAAAPSADAVPAHRRPSEAITPAPRLSDPAGRSPSRVERLTDGPHEIFANRAHPNQALVEKAVAELRRGDLTESWANIPNGYVSPVIASPPTPYYKDTRDSPTLFAKVKAPPLPNGLPEQDPHHPKHELATARRVAELLDTPAAQELADRHHFTGLAAVEPLACVYDAETRTTTTVTPWQEGEPQGGGFAVASGSEVNERVAMLVTDLREFLSTDGINPDDLWSKQLILGPDDAIYITDMQGYSFLPTGEHLQRLYDETYRQPFVWRQPEMIELGNGPSLTRMRLAKSTVPDLAQHELDRLTATVTSWERAGTVNLANGHQVFTYTRTPRGTTYTAQLVRNVMGDVVGGSVQRRTFIGGQVYWRHVQLSARRFGGTSPHVYCDSLNRRGSTLSGIMCETNSQAALVHAQTTIRDLPR